MELAQLALREDLIASGYGPPTQDTMLKHCRQQLREVKLRDFDKKMGFTRHTTSQAAIEWVFERVGRGWVQAALAVVGYRVAAEGELDPALSSVLRAFQRHWRPEAVTGQADIGTLARLFALARLIDVA